MHEAMPLILSETQAGDDSVTLHLQVPAELSLLRGHFPDFPILPGVAQIHWAATLGAERFGPLGSFSRLLGVKFQKPVRPDITLALHLHWDAARHQLGFEYVSGTGSHASGKLEFAAAGDAT